MKKEDLLYDIFIIIREQFLFDEYIRNTISIHNYSTCVLNIDTILQFTYCKVKHRVLMNSLIFLSQRTRALLVMSAKMTFNNACVDVYKYRVYLLPCKILHDFFSKPWLFDTIQKRLFLLNEYAIYFLFVIYLYECECVTRMLLASTSPYTSLYDNLIK